MRVFYTVALATSTAALLAPRASAADFNGPFVGAQVGWQSEKLRDPKSAFGVLPIDERKQSVTGGIYAGYDKTIKDRFVVGTEADLDFASDAVSQATVGGIGYSIDPKYAFDLTARAGYLVTPQTLIYARGGYTNARVRTTVTAAGLVQSTSSNHDGWLAGAGVERQITPTMSARVEYRYSKLTAGDESRGIKGKDERNQVLAGLSYRF